MVERVSIVVRSMGRPEVHDALASLAAQTWPEVEVVVVAASGPEHPVPPSICGLHSIRFVAGDAPRSRPVAANTGLLVATGAFIGLLDDDDLYLPTHIETLVAALHAAPMCPAAYAIAREVDAAGRTGRVRAQPFSRLLLYQDCYIAINSVLFRRAALAQCRFDERFEICEDWDFWLQLAELGDFAFVPAETAVYRASLGMSGTGPGNQRDEERYRRHTALLATKWGQRGREVADVVAAAAAQALDHFTQGRGVEAEAAADRALAAFPYELTALNIKGTLLAMRGDVQGALSQFRLAATEAPGDVASRFNLAQALERLGRAGEAISEYDRILALEPLHPHAAARKSILERQRSGTPS
jgi:tetratricopeptide (TPR) repeat protein